MNISGSGCVFLGFNVSGGEKKVEQKKLHLKCHKNSFRSRKGLEIIFMFYLFFPGFHKTLTSNTKTQRGGKKNIYFIQIDFL